LFQRGKGGMLCARRQLPTDPKAYGGIQ